MRLTSRTPTPRGAIDPTNPDGINYLSRRRHRQQRRTVHLHRNQRLQRQQRTRRHSEQHRRCQRLLHHRQRRQRIEPTARRHRSGRGRTVHHALKRTRELPNSCHTRPTRELLRYRTRRQGRQGRQGRQLPRPDHLQRCRLLHQGQRQQRRQHRLLRRYHRYRLSQRRWRSGRRSEAAHLTSGL